ncbi:MAG TPA: VWA domain-containing protein [Enhygromyxa sp.]|nr:VWA domain-containing protein [Enhygromyxa sp.]
MSMLRARVHTLLLPLLAASVTLAGCGLTLTQVQTAADKPSNVAVYFKVEDHQGEPVGGMTAEQFEIYEDGGLVSVHESKQVILNPDVAASHYTLLLVDMSGSVVESDDFPKIAEAANLFTSAVEKNNKVAIYAFDGDEKIHRLTDFTSSAGGAQARANSLGSFASKDPSTNLNGAIIQGLQVLDEGLSKAENPLKIGTLVVFTDGTDRAARVAKDEMMDAVRNTPYDVFVIGLGEELSEKELQDIGKSGTALAKDSSEIQTAFETIGKRIEQLTKSYYLLSYCTPARAGEHVVTIRAKHTPEGKKKEITGELDTEFDATGFEPKCDPNTKPKFDISKGDMAADEGKGKSKGKASASASASSK